MSSIVRARASGGRKARSLAVLALCEVLGMSLWFSASAVVPALKAVHGIDGIHAAALASSVAVGFVLGTLSSAILGLADRIEPRRFFAAAALAGAGLNGAAVLLDPAAPAFVVLRVMVGASMAGIYPVGIKLAATWAAADMGLLVGGLVGAVTLGSASAYLLAALGDLDWRGALLGASLLAVLAAVLITQVEHGPRLRQATAFRARYLLDAWRQRPLRLVNIGYYGHMWELYAMWAWVAAFLEASFGTSLPAAAAALWAKLGAFLAIGCGTLGCLGGVWIADRCGRTALTIGAMLLSGSCAALAGLLFGSPPWLLVGFCAIWGVAAVADSAQFSASVVELSDPERTGTMVTLQTCVGFLLTTVSIHAIPLLQAAVGWRWAFAVLAVGPFLGAWSMYALRRLPEARRLAAGRR